VLDIRNVNQSFDNQRVLNNINLQMSEGEILCLLGPSGGGKTTLLRIIAGLETNHTGDVTLDGRLMNGVPVHQRGVGFMFQDYALFPHMTVAENIVFGLKMKNMPEKERDKRLQEILDLIGLTGFKQRDVTRLSGGERQRVALARSLAPRPKLLMLDEPLGSLDAVLKERLLPELRSIIKSLGLTAIYVTHDRREAFQIADRIAIMVNGKIARVDTPKNLLLDPHTRFIAEFLGLHNIIPVQSYQNGITETPLGEFSIESSDSPPAALLVQQGGIIVPEDSKTDNPQWVEATVTHDLFLGETHIITVTHSSELSLHFTLHAYSQTIPDVSDRVYLNVSEWTLVPLVD